MSLLLIILGVMMVVAAVRDTQHCLILLFKNEFEGPGNFTYWVAAILIIGAIGMSDTLRPLSNGLLVLALLALFLTRAKRGIFNQLTSALQSTQSGGSSGVGVSLNVVTSQFFGGSAV